MSDLQAIGWAGAIVGLAILVELIVRARQGNWPDLRWPEFKDLPDPRCERCGRSTDVAVLECWRCLGMKL